MSIQTQSNEPPEKGWLSAFLMVFGLGTIIVAVLSIVDGSLFPGMLGVGVAIIFFALRRIIDQQQDTAHRLRQIETELASRRGVARDTIA